MTAFKTLCLGLLALLPATASAAPLDLAALIECRQSVADYRAVARGLNRPPRHSSALQ